MSLVAKKNGGRIDNPFGKDRLETGARNCVWTSRSGTSHHDAATGVPSHVGWIANPFHEAFFQRNREITSLWSFVFSVRSLVFGLWSLVFGLRSSVFGLWSLVFSLRSLVFGLRSPVFGLRSSVFSLRSPLSASPDSNDSLSRRTRPRGFTLLEVTIVSGLTSFFALLIASSWYSFGRSLADAHARCIVAQEATLALETLRRDLAGYPLEQSAGTKDEHRIVGWLITGGSQLRICADGNPINQMADWATPDTVYRYDVQGDQLIRTNQNTNATYVVASHVSQLQLTDLGNGIRVELAFSYRDITRTYTIITRDP